MSVPSTISNLVTLLFHVFFPKNKTGFGWICKGWCRHLPCWPSSTDPSTSNHRPSPHHLKIAVFECLKLMTQACGDLIFFSKVAIALFETLTEFSTNYAKALQCQFQVPSQILWPCFFMFFPQNKTGFGWICKGRCRHLPCWHSSTDPSTSNHRPSPHHLKIAVFECLKLMTQACGDLIFFKSRDRVVRNINRIQYKLCKGSTVSVPSTILNLATCFFPQNMTE